MSRLLKTVSTIVLCTFLMAVTPPSLKPDASIPNPIEFTSSSNSSFDLVNVNSSDSKDRVFASQNNEGFKTRLVVDSKEVDLKNQGYENSCGVKVETSTEKIIGNQYLKVNFVFTNLTQDLKTFDFSNCFRLGEGSQVVSNDNFFSFKNGDRSFIFYLKNHFGVSDVDNFWIGNSNEMNSNFNSQIKSDSKFVSDGNLDALFSWSQKSLQPNEKKVLSFLVSSNQLEDLPNVTFNPLTSNEVVIGDSLNVTGSVSSNDKENVSFMYSFDDSSKEYKTNSGIQCYGQPKDFNVGINVPNDLTSGKHALHVWFEDSRGNTSVSKTYDVNLVDENQPDFKEVKDTTRINNEVNLTIEDTGSGVDKVVLPNGQEVKNDDASKEMNVNYETSSNGNLEFKAVDGSGNESLKTVTVSNYSDKKEKEEDLKFCQKLMNSPRAMSLNSGLQIDDSESKVELAGDESPITWKEGTGVDESTVDFIDVCYGDHQFVAVDANDNIYTSKDGIAWVKSDKKFYNFTESIYYDGDRYISTSQYIATYDKNFNRTSYQFLNYVINSVVHHDHDYVAVGNEGYIYYSNNGTDWSSSQVVNESINFTDVTYGNGKFVAITDHGFAMYSSDGQNWDQSYILGADYSNFISVCYGNGLFLTMEPDYGLLAYSTDGVNWHRDDGTKVYNNKASISAFPGIFVICRSLGSCSYSEDGKNWTDCNTGIHKDFRKAAYGNGRLVIVGEDHLVVYADYDTTKPTLTLSQNTSYTKSTISFSADDSNFSYVLKPDGTKSTSKTGTYDVTSNGAYTFKAYDKAGNYTSKTITVTGIDKTNPTLTLSQSSTAWTKDNVTINFTADDTNFDYVLKPDKSKSTSKTGSYNVSSNGTYSFTAYDKAGNKTSKSITISNIDKTAPTISKVEKVNLSATGYDIYVTCSDNVGVIEVRVPTWTLASKQADIKWLVASKESDGRYHARINFSDWGSKEGYYASHVYAYDAAGNNTGYVTEDYLMDKSNPTLSVSANTTFPAKKVVLSYSADDSNFKEVELPNGSKSSSKTGTYEVTSNGTYIFKATDLVGKSVSKSITVSNIDLTPPSLTLGVNKTSFTSGDVVINFTADDANFSKVELPNGQFSTNKTGSYTVTSNGTYSFKAYDYAGNVTTKSITVSNIDKTAPTLNVSLSSSALTNRNLTISFSADDANFDYVLKPDNSKSTTKTGSFGISSNGVYVFKAYDKAGNSVTKTLTVSNIDKTNPSLSLTVNTTNPSKNVIISYVGDDEHFKSIALPNGSTTTSKTGTYTVSSNGTFTFKASDSVGNETTKTITISNIDRTSPSLELTQNRTDLTNGDVVVSYSADDSNFKSVTLPNGTVSNSKKGTFTVGSNGTFTFVAEDLAGNKTSKSIAISNIDKTLPTGSLSLNTTAYVNSVTINYSGDDDNWDHVVLPNGQSATSKIGSYTVNYSGCYKFEFWDKAGNKTEKSIDVTNVNSITLTTSSNSIDFGSSSNHKESSLNFDVKSTSNYSVSLTALGNFSNGDFSVPSNYLKIRIGSNSFVDFPNAGQTKVLYPNEPANPISSKAYSITGKLGSAVYGQKSGLYKLGFKLSVSQN